MDNIEINLDPIQINNPLWYKVDTGQAHSHVYLSVQII